MSFMFQPSKFAAEALDWWQTFVFYQGDDPFFARVRGEQVSTLYSHSKFNLATMVINAGMLLFAFQGHPRHWMLPLWLAAILILGLFWFARTAYRTSRDATSKTPLSAFWMATLELCLFSVLWAAMLLALMPEASEFQRLLLIVLSFAAMAAVGFAASVMPTATSISTTIIGGALLHALPQPPAVLFVAVITLWFHVVRGSIMTSRTLIVRLKVEEDLRERSAVVRLLIKEFEANGTDWLLEVDAEGRITHASGRFAEALGRSYHELVGLHFLTLMGSPDRENPYIRGVVSAFNERRAYRDLVVPAMIAGEERWWSLSATPKFAADGSFEGYRGVGRDITDVRRSEERIVQLARFDPLTGLANRALFRETLDRELEQVAEDRGQRVLMFVDLDRFKQVNDTMGHAAGDRLLVEVADRLKTLVPGTATLARLGGDEFAVLLADTSDERVTGLVRSIVIALAEPFEIDAQQVRIGCSIGWSLAPRDADCAEQLLKTADLALYEAKEDGKGRARHYVPEMKCRAETKRAIETALPGALERGEFSLVFQPIIDSENEQIVTFEALLRWTHPDLGPLLPDRFIPAAEESGIIRQIGSWVIDNACRAASTWPKEVGIAVNLSPAQMGDPQLAKTVSAALARNGLAPNMLEFEITERLFLEETPETAAQLAALNALGISFVLDDFGSGYSSIGYLKRAMFSRIKIDRSFVSQASQGSDAAAILSAVVKLAKQLRMATTAEGAETREEFETCRDLGCTQVQGYLFGKPMTADEAHDLVWSVTGLAPGEATSSVAGMR